MKDQYVGDQNDYAKYQLLRICASIFEEILVAWMLTAADERTDGARIGYLKRAEWRRADPELFDGLAALVARGERTVAAVEAAKLLPGCSFEADPVPLTLAERGPYFEAIAARATYDSLVFFDPDNGLEVPSVPKQRRGAEKYLFWDELILIREVGSSALIYQHFPYVQRVAYVEAALARLEAEMGEGYRVFASHTPQVAFFFAVHAPYDEPLRTALIDHCSRSPMLAFAG